MNLWLRLAAVLLTTCFRRALGLLDESVLTCRVWPNDLDLNGHMNNGRYLTLMDLGRIDLIIRTGLARAVLRRQWYPLVGSATIRFRHSLKLFQTYQLKSRILCWDEKWFFIEQRFEREGEVVAIGLVKGLLRGRDGNISPIVVLRSMNIGLSSPEIPPAIKIWQQSEALTVGSISDV